MGSTKLKEDLTNCLITFDRRVLITELLDDYKLPYEEVNNVLENYLKEQENKDKLKYEKKYVVHGIMEGENKKEIYKIVEEQKQKEWLNKLINAQSSLYSVEVLGGAKSSATVFKPMREEEGVKLRPRTGAKTATTNGEANTGKKSLLDKNADIIKAEIKKPEFETSGNKVLKETPNTSTKSSPKTEDIITKTSPKSEKSSKDKKSANKKGINNFFAPSAATSKKTDESKEVKTFGGAMKPPSPKKMQDFFKKQTEKPKSTESSTKTPASNTSIQLFDSEEEEEPEEVSSDEEEKIEALKRDIISSDVEMDDGKDEGDDKTTTSIKRRRILDSEDEDEDPPVKQEKLDTKEESPEKEDNAEQLNETYLDEDGFVITKKPKQTAKTVATKPPATKKTPAVTLKTSPKESKKKTSPTNKDIKGSTNSSVKTKQAGIMNFFTKK